MQKRVKILSKFQSRKIVVLSKLCTKMHNFYKLPYTYLVNTLLKFQINFCPSFPWNVTHKKKIVNAAKKKLRQNTVSLKQQIYAGQENFPQPLVVMVETFRRFESALMLIQSIIFSFFFFSMLLLLLLPYQCTLFKGAFCKGVELAGGRNVWRKIYDQNYRIMDLFSEVLLYK